MARSSPRQLARQAGLLYVTDDQPGIHRHRCGGGFRYLYESGRHVKDERQLSRLKSLAIPPAWTDVWICRNARGHLQATGRDEKGRKQFLYHPRWQDAANLAKFKRLTELGSALPRIRRRVSEQLRHRDGSYQKTLALLVRLLDLTGMRVGHERYMRENGAVGLTTLRRKHVQLNGSSIEFRFNGKSQQKQVVVVTEPTTLRALRRNALAGGGYLFTDGDGKLPVTGDEVNDYLRRISGVDITAKDFRTWLASALAAAELYELRDETNQRQRKQNLVTVTKAIASRLGNTPTVCRGSYLDPRMLHAYEVGRFPSIFAEFQYRRPKWLRREDQAFRHLLKQV